jgi:hypothetical protein
VQSLPLAAKIAVGVSVGVGVSVCVGVNVPVAVGVNVGVEVSVGVHVEGEVAVGVPVAVGVVVSVGKSSGVTVGDTGGQPLTAAPTPRTSSSIVAVPLSSRSQAGHWVVPALPKAMFRHEMISSTPTTKSPVQSLGQTWANARSLAGERPRRLTATNAARRARRRRSSRVPQDAYARIVARGTLDKFDRASAAG